MKLIILNCILFFVSHQLVSGQDNGVKFNHIYFVVDSATFQEIRNEFSNRQFANLDQGMPTFTPLDSNTTTIYMRGKHTYLEIMSPKNKFNELIGRIGIGFSFDTKSPLTTDIKSKIKSIGCLELEEYSYSWKFDDTEMLWFKSYYVQRTSDVATWYAFYNPDFLSKLFSKEINQYHRQSFLEYSYDPNKSFTDITAIELECNPIDYAMITNEWHCFGIEPDFSSETKKIFIIDKVSFTLTLKNIENSRLRKITLASKDEQKENKSIGKLKLKGEPAGLSIIF